MTATITAEELDPTREQQPAEASGTERPSSWSTLRDLVFRSLQAAREIDNAGSRAVQRRLATRIAQETFQR